MHFGSSLQITVDDPRVGFAGRQEYSLWPHKWRRSDIEDKTRYVVYGLAYNPTAVL